MKNLLFLLMLISGPMLAQDVFKQHLYSPELIFKYRDKIELSQQQADKIKEVYNNSTLEYNNFKWELDAKMIKLEEMLAQSRVDTERARVQLQEIVELENQIKVMRLQTMVSIKNTLNAQQQSILDSYKDETDEGYEIMTSVNEDPRVVVRVNGERENKEPLYVVKEGNEVKEVKSLKNYDPNQIESIEVLKGSSAIKQYGDKGKNGVVIITLK